MRRGESKKFTDWLKGLYLVRRTCFVFGLGATEANA
jgi:hypothetical protein